MAGRMSDDMQWELTLAAVRCPASGSYPAATGPPVLRAKHGVVSCPQMSQNGTHPEGTGVLREIGALSVVLLNPVAVQNPSP